MLKGGEIQKDLVSNLTFFYHKFCGTNGNVPKHCQISKADTGWLVRFLIMFTLSDQI